MTTLGNAIPGDFNQTQTITIVDNDNPPTEPGAVRTIYTENFAGGLPATWQNIDNTGGGTWTHSTAPPANWTAYGLSGSPSFTSAANGFVLFDSDGFANDGNAEDAELITLAFDCSNYSNAILNFEQQFCKYQSDITTVGVSNDGTNFTMTTINTGISQDACTDNPQATTIDISAVADGQATVYLLSLIHI